MTTIVEEAPRKRRRFKPYAGGQANVRQARFRDRRRAGVAVAAIEYDAAVVDFLVRTAWLPPDEVHERNAVGSAVSRMLSDAARR